MAVKFTNNAKTTLASGINSSVTTATVTDGSVFPTLAAGEHFYCTFDDGTNNEIVKVTARSGNTLTIIRGVDNTTARSFTSGDAAELRATSALLTDIQENIAAKSANQTVYNTTTASSATDYDIGIDPSVEANAMVFLNGVMQHHDTFSFSGSTLTFDTAPPDGMALEVIVDNLINLQSSNLTVDTFTAADVGGNPQTDFTLSDAPASEDNLLVFIDGVFQDQDAYTISNQTLTITDGVTADFGVTVYVINPVNIGTPSDGTVTSSKLSGNITMPADLTVTGDVAFDSPTFVVDNANSRVGIGTASPSTLLDIVGDVKMSANLTVDTDTLHVDATNNRVGIGTSSPTAKLDVSGDGTWIRHSGYGQLLDMGNWTDGLVRIESTGAPMYIRAAGSNYMAFDTNSVERLRINSSGNVLVGTTSVGYSSVDLTVGDTTDSQNGLAIQTSTTGYGYVLFGDGSGADAYRGQLFYKHGDDYMGIHTAGAERMRIDSSGNVGIGTNSPTSYYEGADNLVVLGTDEAGITVVTPNNRTGALYFADGTTSAERYKGGIAYQHANDTLILVSGGASKVAIDENGYVGIGDLSPAHKLEIQSLDNYKAVHIKGTNAPCYTMARGTGSDAEWRMGLSGYDYEDFAISAGTGTGDKFRIDPNGNSWQGNVNNYTPRDGLHDIGQTASFNGPIASGYAEGPGGNGAAPIIHDWFVYSSASNIGSNNYVHMKTSLLGGGTGAGNQDFTMSCFTYHNYYGYGSNYYGYGVIGWHNWSGSFYNVMKNNYGNFNLVQDSYISSDGYVVLVAYIQAAYAQFTIDWAQWAGYTFRQARVTDVTNTSSATGAY